jgi:hypothetical protein
VTDVIRTADELLERLRAFGPDVEGTDLVFESAPPDELAALLEVLHTGIRARLSGRRWWACLADSPRAFELNPAAQLPPRVALLAVGGDALWDRVPPDAEIDAPHLFFQTSERAAARTKRDVGRLQNAEQPN